VTASESNGAIWYCCGFAAAAAVVGAENAL
jgi:hypothetical protein